MLPAKENMDFAILSVQIMRLVSFLTISCIQIIWLKSYFIKFFIFSRPNKSTSDNNTTTMPNYFWQSKTKSTMCISIPVPRCDILRWVVWIFWNQILFARTIKIDWNIFWNQVVQICAFKLELGDGAQLETILWLEFM